MTTDKPINGNGASDTQQVQVNPTEAAQWALMFLARAQFNAQERRAFDVVEALLQAIASGRVQITQAPQAPSEDAAGHSADAPPLQ